MLVAFAPEGHSSYILPVQLEGPMPEGSTDSVEGMVVSAAAASGESDHKSWWDRAKSYWWVSGFSSAFALVHLLDGLGFSREWLRVFHVISTGWERALKVIGDLLRSFAPIPIDLSAAELSMITIYSGVLLPAMLPWIKGDAVDHAAMEKTSPLARNLIRGLAPAVILLAIGMLLVSLIGFCLPGDSVATNPGLMDPTSELPGGWREFGRLYVFGAAIMMIAIWNRPYFRVLVIVGGFLVMLEVFNHVPVFDAAMQPFIDWVDPAGAKP